MDNTASFTAEAALDDQAPRNLQIASFQVSPNMLSEEVKEVSVQEFKIHQLSSLEHFAEAIKKQRPEDPAGENELYAKFQQGQYMYSMFMVQNNEPAHDRYKGILWSSSTDYLRTFLQ